MQLQTTHPHRAHVTAATGEHSPASGWWRLENDMDSMRYMQQGEIMPSHEGCRTIWIFVHQVDPLLWTRRASLVTQAINHHH